MDKIIQLLGRQGYDRETLQYADKIRLKPREDDDEDFEPLIATVEYSAFILINRLGALLLRFLCYRCSTISSLLSHDVRLITLL